MVLSRMDIDVLVQLAYLGPGDAESWQPLTDDPDRTGALLWSRNYEVAADLEIDGTVPEYRFEPLPVTITAVEGVKHCEFYRYQTENDGDWTRDGVGKLLRTLRAKLISAMPEHRSAPWGWGPKELEERMERPRPVIPGPPEEADPRVARWLQDWKAAGLPLTQLELTADLRKMVPDPRELLAYGYYRPGRYGGFAPVLVTLCATEEAAETCFTSQLRRNQTSRWLDVHVYRLGTTIAVSTFMPAQDAELIPVVAERIARLGPPDRHWWSLAPPVREMQAQVLSSRVRLSASKAGAHSDARAIYARTPKQREVLLELLADPEVRELVAGVDTRKKTLLLLRGVSEVRSVEAVKIEEELIDNGLGDSLEHAMYIKTVGASMAIGTLIVLDRLGRTPARATLIDHYVSQAMIGDLPVVSFYRDPE
jgi:hypothetical protein